MTSTENFQLLLLLLLRPLPTPTTPARLALGELSPAIDALVARGTAVVLTTHRRREWPASTTHELELWDGRAIYAGVVREGPRRPGQDGSS